MFTKQLKYYLLVIFLFSNLLIPNLASAGDLVNVSTRGMVGTGQEKMIVGFIVEGSGNKQFILAAIGPTLFEFGIDGALADPKFELYQNGLRIFECDNWKNCPGADIVEGYLSLFGQSLKDSEAAVAIELAAGSYSIQISGANGGTGIAIGTAIEPFLPGNIVTVAQINSGQIPLQSIVVMAGKAVTQLDGDDYIFADHTGEIKVEWEGAPSLPLGKLIQVEGKVESDELEIRSFRALE